MNEHKIKFKIGEFSKLNMVTIKTLRHYEEIGLLVPDEIDQWTGYRYYRVDQLNKMNKIIFLKRLGFNLEEIREVFDEENQTPDIDQIKSKIEQCRKEMLHLQWRQTELSRLESTLHKKKIMEQVIIKSLPAVIVASHRRVITSYQELFHLCPNVIGPEMARLGCICANPEYAYTIDHNKEYSDTNIDLEYCEAVIEKRENSDMIQFKDVAEVKTAICVNHYGVYDLFPQTFAQLYEYIEQNGFRIVDSPRFCYIDGIWNKESEEEWLTEIQVPVEKV
ncbi:MAG: MerR family transcriptional regulator [uncultured bacterium]|nr:MAG: MerR family transcriptional regulator [uncultured bacterium]HBY01424.1 MerR family transcriptional regulator [Rikenellaceae bacterium]